MNSGLPSLRSWTSRAKSDGNACSGNCSAMYFATATEVERARRDLAAHAARDQIELHRTGTDAGACASSDGRHVAMISRRVVSIRRARYASRSVVGGSAQCMSSKHRTTGCIRPSSSNSAASSRFSRSCEPAGGLRGQARRRRLVVGRRHDLRVPARRNGADQARDAAELLVLLQAVERFEDRQVGFAAGEPLGTAAAADAHRLPAARRAA